MEVYVGAAINVWIIFLNLNYISQFLKHYISQFSEQDLKPWNYLEKMKNQNQCILLQIK